MKKMKKEREEIRESDTLNRSERRRNERKVNKLESWIKSLDKDKLELIETFCNEAVEGSKENMCKDTLKARNMAMGLVKEGKNQSESLKILEMEFNGLSKSNLINIYKECKEEFKSMKENMKKDFKNDVDKAMEYIFEDKVEVKEVKKSKLEVVQLEVKGENGIYTVNNFGVELQNGEKVSSFPSLDVLEACRKQEIDKINKFCDEVREVFEIKENN